MSCSVFNCKNYFRKTSKVNPPIKYYRFPKDENLRKIWLKHTRRAQDVNSNNGRICSVHFTDEDYSNEIINGESVKTLKPDATPSVNLGYPTEYSNSLLFCKKKTLKTTESDSATNKIPENVTDNQLPTDPLL